MGVTIRVFVGVVFLAPCAEHLALYRHPKKLYSFGADTGSVDGRYSG